MTPDLETAEALKLLEMHERTAHNGRSGAPIIKKPEKFPRPTVGIDETSEKWGGFATAWEQYKQEYNLSKHALTRQL